MSKRELQLDNDYSEINKSIKDAIFNGIQQPRSNKKRTNDKEYENTITNRVKKRRTDNNDNNQYINIYINNLTFADNINQKKKLTSLKQSEHANINTNIKKNNVKCKFNNKKLLSKRYFYINNDKIKYEINKDDTNHNIIYSASTYKVNHTLYLKNINNSHNIQNLINNKLINIITISNNLNELDYFWNKFKSEFIYHIVNRSNNRYIEKILNKI